MEARRLVVVGTGEVAEHLLRLADMLGYASVTSAGSDLPDDLGAGDDLVVTVEEGAQACDLVRRAVLGDCGYIGLVAPHRDAVRALLALSSERLPPLRLERVAAPAGVAIGAQTPGEIAVAVAAELVARRRGASPEEARINGPSGGGTMS
jgi:xanthine dehydrogenase accessory factor